MLFILIPFSISLAIEIYHNGGFKFKTPDNAPTSYPVTEKPDSSKPKIELQNLKDGFTTKDTSISVVVLTDAGNTAVINNEKVNVDDSGRFERKLDLIVGGNQITITVKNKDGVENSISLIVNREEEPKPQLAPDPAPNPVVPNPVPNPSPVNPAPAPQPTPQPQPAPQPPPPPPPPLTGLKLSCSITNTHPSVGQSVTVNCNVKDQSNNPVSGAFGYVTVNWKSGSTVYTLSQSDSGGNMNVNFKVPSGNSGSSVSATVQASKSGLNVSSSFTLSIQ